MRGWRCEDKFQTVNGFDAFFVVGAVVGVSDFLMTALAKGTVALGKKAGSAIAASDVSANDSV